MIIPFAKHAYQSRSLPVSAQRCVNLYPELQPPDAKYPITLHGTPGLNLKVNVGNGPIYGIKKMAGVLYVVSGQELYSVSSSWVAILIGSIPVAGRVSMATNGTQLVIVDGTSGWVYSASGGLVSITDADFNASYTATFQDTYIILEETGTGRFYISASGDATSYNALDFATAEGDPDNTIAVLSDHRELWLFGEESTEVWYNSGDTFTFSRVAGAFVERGCAAKYTPQKMANTVYWLGNDGVVYEANGYIPVRISTHAIEYAISKYTLSDAIAYTYTQEGHYFYVLTFPTDKKTWVYDSSSKLWHEREDYKVGRHRSNCYEHVYSTRVVGDFENGNIYALDLDKYTDNGTTIKRTATSPPVHDDRRRISQSYMEVDIESGGGLTTGQGSDPQAMLRYSNDSGRTWSNEKWRTMGKIGEYSRRASWYQLGGNFRERVFELTISDPIKISIVAAHGTFA